MFAGGFFGLIEQIYRDFYFALNIMNVLNISKVYPLSYMCDEWILYIETFPADGRPAQYSVSIVDPCLRPEPD